MGPWLNHSTLGDFTLLGIFSHNRTDLVLFSAILVVFIVALAGNTLLLFLIYSDAQLHTPMYFFLSHLSLMDLTLICTIVPKMADNFIRDRKSISFIGCGLQIGFFVSLVGSEGLLLGLMAYDRYVAINHPLRYHVLMSQRVCLQIVGSSWAFGTLDGLIQVGVGMTFPFCGSREVDHFFCEVLALSKLACADTSLFDTLIFYCCVFMLFLPFSIIVASYAKILRAVINMNSTQARQKALTTCSSHLAAVSLFYGAAMFIYLRPKRYRAPGHDKIVSLFYTILTPMLNPLIYSLRNREVMRALRKRLSHWVTGCQK
ncbi:olfactory receptor 56-like [Trichosurus vulpecula]|uniref:olfactory receptor 56-like n=1 Tax=Trichosurus vulpecula TaxID=9337 RepID=UPI00186B4896|nr:olfactory receptor 56-like [Trichosurus vulpecula]